MGNKVNVVDPQSGAVTAIDEAQLPGYASQGFRVEGTGERAERVNTEARKASTSGVEAFAHGVVSTAVPGFDTLATAIGGEGARVQLQRYKEAHPTLETAGELGGMVLDPAGVLSKARGLGAASEGAGVARQIAGKAVGGAAEGAAIGGIQGANELALSGDPVTLDHIASTMSSNMLYGGALGGGLGLVGGVAERGLLRAKSAVGDALEARAAAHALPEDLATLDAKGLRGAEKTELETIEAGRVPQRAQLADDIGAFRGELEEQKIWLATKDAESREVREIGKISLDADKRVDRLLNNPKMLAEKPELALSGLQQQEHALELLAKQEPNLRVAFAADETGARAAALDQVPSALEKNRELQQRIRELKAEPASERLAAIRDAKDVLTSGGGGEKSLPEKMLAGSVFGAVSGAMHALPIPGTSLAAHLVGAKAADAATKLVFGKLGAAASESALKTTQLAEAVLGGAKRAGSVVLPTATATLARVRYAPEDAKATVVSTPRGETLPTLFAKRSAEVRSQTAYNAAGAPEMRPAARQAVAERLSPIRAVSPLLADQLETAAARRIEYLSSMLPRRPDMMTIGADTWRPSDMEMRAWARRAAAAEDPGGVEERIAHGIVSPEDVETYKAVYPERAADFQHQVMSRLTELRTTLPYPKKLALSLFTGVPVDPALAPNVLSVLQGQFQSGAPDGGTSAPKAQPQFGSVKKSVEEPTPGQHRAQG